jgi:hypothetical protein
MAAKQQDTADAMPVGVSMAGEVLRTAVEAAFTHGTCGRCERRMVLAS